jgi:hypothetical protein
MVRHSFYYSHCKGTTKLSSMQGIFPKLKGEKPYKKQPALPALPTPDLGVGSAG